MSLYNKEERRKSDGFLMTLIVWDIWLTDNDPQIEDFQKWIDYTVEIATYGYLRGGAFGKDSLFHSSHEFTDHLLGIDKVYFQRLTKPYDLREVYEHVKGMYRNTEGFQLYLSRRNKLELLLDDE